MGNLIYKIKDDVNFNKLGELGWDIIPGNDGKLIFLKFSIQPENGDLYIQLLQAYYLNSEWIRKVYNANKKGFKEKLGLRYTKKGKIMPNKKFEKALTHWIMEISEEDRWIGFTSYDPFDLKTYYGKPILDRYCEEELKLLKENDLIEEYEVIE